MPVSFMAKLISASFVCVLQAKTKMSIAFSPIEGEGGGGFQMGHIVPMTTITTSSPQNGNHYPTGTDGKGEAWIKIVWRL
jgi:hypothetical protein